MIFIIIGDLIGVPVIYEYARTDPDTRNPDTYRTDISYEQIAIDPDNYQSENIVISGTVIQLLEDKSTTIRYE